MRFCIILSRFATIVMAITFFSFASAYAKDLKFTVKDEKGRAVEEAVVYLISLSGELPQVKKGTVEIMEVDQINKQFIPQVLAVQMGTMVKFPNSDNIMHHVYSFSPAKQFELPLYKGRQAPPVLFDKAGVVVLGCNIHDWMRAYIVVLGTSYFKKTDKGGSVVIKDMPLGEYHAFVWHADLKGAPETTLQKISLNKTEKVDFIVKLKQKTRVHHAPEPADMMQY